MGTREMNFSRKITAVGLFATSLVLISCASSPIASNEDATCRSTDWFEQGRQDGSTGDSPRVEKYEKSCGPIFDKTTQALYMNGYHSGMTEFCTPENGFQVAQMGGSQENQCPELMKENFRQGYFKGVKARELKAKNQELALKIESLSQKVHTRSIASNEDTTVESELERLKKQYAQNQKRIEQMNN